MSYIGNVPTNVAFLTDQFNGNGSLTAFTLSAAPANTNSILVAVSGVLQDPTTYSVSGTTLTFSAAPPAGTGNISVRFLGIPASGVTTTAYRTVTEFTATAGQTTFTPPSYTVGYINVYRNGALLGTADYTATNGTTVVLTNAASLGDLVVVESFYVSSVLNAIPATAGAVNSTYLLDGSVTQAKLGTGVAGTGPAFSAYKVSGNQSVANNAQVVAVLDTKLFDTNGCFNNTSGTVTLNGISVPAYSFAPNRAGYYQINGRIDTYASSGLNFGQANIYVNGASYKSGGLINISAGEIALTVSCLVYLNGTSDYVTLYGYVNGSAGQVFLGGQANLWMDGAMVRSA